MFMFMLGSFTGGDLGPGEGGWAGIGGCVVPSLMRVKEHNLVADVLLKRLL